MSTTRVLAGIMVLCLAICGWSQEEQAMESDLELAIMKPISNPVFHGSAYPQTHANLLYLYHRLPDRVTITGGGSVPVDGQVQIWALQLEYAFTDQLSFVANKSGYVDMDPEFTLSEEEGFGNIAFGLKYAPYLTEKGAIALRGTFEVPNGNDKIFHGNGDGSFSPAILATYNHSYATLNGAAGVILPFDNQSETTFSYVSTGLYAHPTHWFHPLVELNWFQVLHAGDGDTQFDDEQGGDLVPSVVGFDDGGFFNFGAGNASENRDFVTAAFGCWIDVHPNVSLGFAYELPLTEEEDSLMDDRYNVNILMKW